MRLSEDHSASGFAPWRDHPEPLASLGERLAACAVAALRSLECARGTYVVLLDANLTNATGRTSLGDRVHGCAVDVRSRVLRELVKMEAWEVARDFHYTVVDVMASPDAALGAFADFAKALFPSEKHFAPDLYFGLQTPTLWSPGESEGLDAAARALLENADVLLEDLDRLIASGSERAAYPKLVRGEEGWLLWSLFRTSSGWNSGRDNTTLCDVVPRSCAALHKALSGVGAFAPDARLEAPHMENAEELSFFGGRAGTHVYPHVGGSNARVNVHLCLRGCSGSHLVVYAPAGPEFIAYEDKRVAAAFSDGIAHEVHIGPTDRFIFVIGMRHPALLVPGSKMPLPPTPRLTEPSRD